MVFPSLPCVHLSFPTLCGHPIIDYAKAVQSTFSSSSVETTLYLAVDVARPLEEVSSAFLGSKDHLLSPNSKMLAVRFFIIVVAHCKIVAKSAGADSDKRGQILARFYG